MYLTLEEWAKASGGKIIAGDPGIFVGGENPGGLSIDTRTLTNGDWFIAIKGTRDGHDFLHSAILSGVKGVIVSDPGKASWVSANFGTSIPALQVGDAIGALADASRAILDKFKPFTIAITGTVGKTSVKEAVAHICSTNWQTKKNPHNWNTEIGLPLTVFDITADDKIAVFECASRGAGQIDHLSKIARPDIAVVTSIGPGHLSEFGSIDNVARSKWEILDGLKPGGIIVACGDDQYTSKYAKSGKLITFGTDRNSNVYPLDITLSDMETVVEIETPGGSFKTRLPGSSKADLMNALCATAIVISVKGPDGVELSLEEIGIALSSLPCIAGRSETIIRPSGVEVIFDAYNSNPMSLGNALEYLAHRKYLSDGTQAKRRVAILGDMLELGDDEKKYHLGAGAQAAKLPLSLLVTVGDLAALMKMGAGSVQDSSLRIRHFDTTEKCDEALPGILKPGDLVLIKASRALEFEKLLRGDW